MQNYAENIILILMYLLTTIGLTPGGSHTAHIYTQTIHGTTQLTSLFGLTNLICSTVKYLVTWANRRLVLVHLWPK